MLTQLLAERANLVSTADFKAHHKRCSAKILKLRRQQGLITRPSKSASPHPKPGSPEILVWESERCWAMAMELKSALEARAGKNLRSRSHNKLSKAAKYAAEAAEKDPSSLDVQTFAALALADLYAARNSWKIPLDAYSQARLGLETYANPICSDYIQAHVDPALKLAIQNNGGSDQDIATFARSTARNTPIGKLVAEQHPETLHTTGGLGRGSGLSGGENENPVAQLGAIEFGEHSAYVKDADLARQILITRENDNGLDPTNAEQFDTVLQNWADSRDLTRALLADAAPEDELHIVNTWVEYSLITRRVQRDDLASAAVEPNAGVRLLENILQSCVELAELPGVYADEMRGQSIDAMTSYFKSRRCALLARAYAQRDEDLNALALISRAKLLVDEGGDIAVHDLPVTQHTLQQWRSQVALDLKRAHGSALIHSQASHSSAAQDTSVFPVGPAKDVLTNIIDTTKLRPIPVKPVFYDLAYSCVEYPQHKNAQAAAAPVQRESSPSAEKKSIFGLFKK